MAKMIIITAIAPAVTEADEAGSALPVFGAWSRWKKLFEAPTMFTESVAARGTHPGLPLSAVVPDGHAWHCPFAIQTWP